MDFNEKYIKIIEDYASDILNSHGMELEKSFVQHGSTSTFMHSVSVTIKCIQLVEKLNLEVDMKCLIRGALLHDYYLYDWHNKDERCGLHGFTHASEALKKASSEFALSEIEKNMIYCHMFPLNLFRVPKYRESMVLCLADKICATHEVYEENIYKILKFRYV